MIDYDYWYDEIDGKWPVKRHQSVKVLEKEKLKELVATEEDFCKLKTKIEIEIEDKPAFKLKPLVNLIEETFKVTFKPIVSVPVIVTQDSEPVKSINEVEEAFEQIFSAWPEHEIAQNKKNAHQAFVEAVRHYDLEEVKAACNRYIEENSSPGRAAVKLLGIKRFVSHDDILENWIEKSKIALSNYDTSWFEAVWTWYPDFTDKDKEDIKQTSLSFYRRFVKDADVVDFFCAVKSYASERKFDSYRQQDNEDYDSEDDLKYTKKFVNFVRVWKDQKYDEYLVDLLIGPMVKALRKRDVPYWIVYPEEMHQSALRYNCKQRNDKGEPMGCVWVVTKYIENISNYLTTGKNSCNIVVNSPVDYSIVSEVIGAAKEMVKRIKPKCQT